MPEKRGREGNAPPGGRNVPKKHKPNGTQDGSAYQSRGTGANRIQPGTTSGSASPAPQPNAGRVNPVLAEISQMPDPKKCGPCKISAAEMQTGMLALLEQLIDQECEPQGSSEILTAARSLRHLLYTRSVAPPSSSYSRKTTVLNTDLPETFPHIHIPPYTESLIRASADLPPLPPITEPYLQEAVFTHSSAHNSKTLTVKGYRGDEINYERLEFLGDAYIEIIASRIIYSRFPHIETSQQSQLRESLVKNETLGHLSSAYRLGDRLKHGGHTAHSKSWTKVLADVFEAYIAAIVLSDPETGFLTAETWLTELWAPTLLDFKVKPLENPRAREELNKLVAAKGIKLDYRQERNMTLEDGKQKYYMGIYLTGWGYVDEWLGSGEGQNKSQACIFAAMDALKDRNGVVGKANVMKLLMYPPKPVELDGESKGTEGKAETMEGVKV